MNTATRARFWVFYKSSFVRLTLAPGQTLHHGYSEPTDEGWTASHTLYEHHGDYIRLEAHDAGRDCDGLTERGYEARADLDQLAAYPCEGLLLPQWGRMSEHQRDHSAEAMNY